MKRFNHISILGIVSFVLLIAGCDKTKLYENTIPPEQAHFGGEETQIYSVVGTPAPVFNIEVGTTTVSETARVINYTVTSPSGAGAAQYTIGTKGSVTIPAGGAIAYIDVHGISSAYLSGRKDTLVFYLTAGPVENATFADTVKLILKGPCFDGDVSDINIMSGNYANSTDPDDPKYTAKISGMTQLTPTTATAKIGNLWDVFNDVNIIFDWTNPLSTNVSIANQLTGVNYAAGQQFSIRTSPGQSSKFSVCNEQITMIVDIIVNNYPAAGQAAYYAQNYKMTIRR